jgi:hypothetical protein
MECCKIGPWLMSDPNWISVDRNCFTFVAARASPPFESCVRKRWSRDNATAFEVHTWARTLFSKYVENNIFGFKTPWSQSCDLELQRQRCQNLQRK